MCGIVGHWDQQDLSPSVTEKMISLINHRGPDGAGIWRDNRAHLVLGHKRLSIIDLSQAGHQPMTSICDRFVIVFNGEIYNHVELRARIDSETDNYSWRGHSDTEVLLACLSLWGVEKTLMQLNGMFAFAVWDKFDSSLILARDRLGEKPLYYGRSHGSFLFGSELKAMTVHPAWTGEIDRSALSLYLRYSYVPSPWSIYKNIYKLSPAHYVVISDDGKYISEPVCYWRLADIIEDGVKQRKSSDEHQLEARLDGLLRDCVSKRMMADVPLGAFLSGGIDSSMVAAQMQANSSRPIKTFTIGFEELEFNQASYAKKVAKHLNTEHHELYISHTEALSVIPKLPNIYDEPFADVSQIPTFLVSELASNYVKVCLSGDGGDELFCGYNRYASGYNVWKNLSWLPVTLRRLIGGACHRAPNNFLEFLQKALPKRYQVNNLHQSLPKLAKVLSEHNPYQFYQNIISHWANPDELLFNSEGLPTSVIFDDGLKGKSDFRENMMYMDMMMYLPDDVLTKVDRASMASSIEARVPLLDHRLVEFAWSLPMSVKYNQGQGKWLLKKILHNYIPHELIERPKMGFGVPIENWLRGPLRDWAEELLDESVLRAQGYLNYQPIRQLWKEFLYGQGGKSHQLWTILMFQAWMKEWHET